MRNFFRWLSRHKTESPDTLSIEELTVELLEVRQVIAELLKDQATVNTAINRIERKQNRWIDLMNIGGRQGSLENLEGSSGDGHLPVEVGSGQAIQGILPGDEEE